MGNGASLGDAQQQAELVKAANDLVQTIDMQDQYMKKLVENQKALANIVKAKAGLDEPKKKQTAKHPILGVVRLDYNYPPAEGDVDCPASYGYDLLYKVCPGLTFQMAQGGKFTEEVEREFASCIKYLEMKGASAITGDCGFMMAFQLKARQIASKPVFMSSMCQCPLVATAFDDDDLIIILTANSESLKPAKDVLLEHAGFDVSSNKFKIVGCQDVPGFDAVARGEEVPLNLVQPGIIKKCLDLIASTPRTIAAFIMECTELPPYSDALRAATGLPVWDAITAADFYISAFQDNPRFGINDWQAEFDGVHEDYHFGDNTIQKEREKLKYFHGEGKEADLAKKRNKMKQPKKNDISKVGKKLQKKANPILGIIRLDYNYPPAAGDIDCPGSYDYDCLYRVVPGLTFDMAQAGVMTTPVLKEFKLAVKWLESKGAVGITGDCGFMMAFQPIARQVASIPVFMSSMVQCPMISLAFDKYDKVLILTANSATLKPQKDVLLSHCGFNVDDNRFLIIGLQDVPGFDAVEKGQKVDVEFVTPGIVEKARKILKANPKIRAICLECTELPPYADALRKEFKLPVFDAITNCDFFIAAFQDNPRFGLNNWQTDWDQHVNEYTFGQNLNDKQKKSSMFYGQ
jgi:Asp/Glu/hydantoin racemase